MLRDISRQATDTSETAEPSVFHISSKIHINYQLSDIRPLYLLIDFIDDLQSLHAHVQLVRRDSEQASRNGLAALLTVRTWHEQPHPGTLGRLYIAECMALSTRI